MANRLITAKSSGEFLLENFNEIYPGVLNFDSQSSALLFSQLSTQNLHFVKDKLGLKSLDLLIFNTKKKPKQAILDFVISDDSNYPKLTFSYKYVFSFNFNLQFPDTKKFFLSLNSILCEKGEAFLSGFFHFDHQVSKEQSLIFRQQGIESIKNIIKEIADLNYDYDLFKIEGLPGFFIENQPETEHYIRNNVIGYYFIKIVKPDLKSPIDAMVDKFQKGDIEKYDYIREMNRINRNLNYFSKHLTRSDISKIEILDNDLIFTTRNNGWRFHFNGQDRRGAPFEILNFNSYEADDKKILSALLTRCETIFDIGANIGWYSVLFSKEAHKAKIYSFEPIPDTFYFLEKNIEENQLNNVLAYNQGLGEANENLDFYYFPQGSVVASQKNLLGCKKSLKVKCSVVKLDHFVNENNINNIDFMKCDVEGAELSVFKGGIKTISNSLPIIFTELYHGWCSKFGYHPNDIIKFLKKFGYHCFYPVNNSLMKIENLNEEPKEERLNYFFLHADKHQEEIRDFLLNE